MCPVYFVNHVTGLYLTLALSQREREGVRMPESINLTILD